MRLLPRSAAVLALLISACEKKSESSGTGNGAAPAAASPRREREDHREGEEAEAKVALRQALEDAGKESDPAAREKAVAAVAWDAIDVDRELAQQAFAALAPGGEEARRLIAHFAMRLADTDPEAALEWARGLEQPAERDDALGRVAAVISATDPQRAAALALEEVPEGPLRDRTVVQVVQRWSQSAPADAGKWVAALPAGRARSAALEHLAGTWSAADAPAFAAWASKQEPVLPEVTTAIASSLRTIRDDAERTKRLAAFTDPDFRGRIEAELSRAALQLPHVVPANRPENVPPAK
ncbi:hypothetical protein OKA05_00690 [Luteolibacter arcticus]|uniref:HEAT repeat domain-containing protein n=1 Tax=Luteolibacter arcticus TaxID=1581411 RepID=A0ABT3GBU7_9BACT|nr:hypothetical protein [Luteolibacter arcticus]MCW1921049.1 hypothetical protein [Luteolibacter arcticus]